jgi:hypothetical protein
LLLIKIEPGAGSVVESAGREQDFVPFSCVLDILYLILVGADRLLVTSCGIPPALRFSWTPRFCFIQRSNNWVLDFRETCTTYQLVDHNLAISCCWSRLSRVPVQWSRVPGGNEIVYPFPAF